MLQSRYENDTKMNLREIEREYKNPWQVGFHYRLSE